MGRGWGREELMSVNSKTMAVLHVGGGGRGGGGGTSSWPGLEQGLGRMEVVRDCKCECTLGPLFASDS